MTTPSTPPNPLGSQRGGSKPKLSAAEKSAVCAILTSGGTREMAAAYVGCCVRTIRRQAARDPQFAERILHAERIADIDKPLRPPRRSRPTSRARRLPLKPLRAAALNEMARTVAQCCAKLILHLDHELAETQPGKHAPEIDTHQPEGLK